MEKYLLDHDVTVFYVLADSFPQGILKAPKIARLASYFRIKKLLWSF